MKGTINKFVNSRVPSMFATSSAAVKAMSSIALHRSATYAGVRHGNLNTKAESHRDAEALIIEFEPERGNRDRIKPDPCIRSTHRQKTTPDGWIWRIINEII